MIHDSDQHIETPSTGLRIGAVGWQHAGWHQGFYPDDLPEDWQLSYYANEFSTVLVPADYWQGDGDADELLEQVPDSFLFYLQCSDEPGACEALLAVGEQLGAQFGGLLTRQPLASPAIGNIYSSAAADDSEQAIWTPGNQARSGIGVLSLGDADIKTWRHWLEQFARCSGGNLAALLVSDDEVSMPQLQQLKTLVELMGF